MTDSKVSGLSAASALVGTETLPVVQGGANVKATVTDINRALRRVINLGTSQAVGGTTYTAITGLNCSLEPGTWRVRYFISHWSNANTNGLDGAKLNCVGGTVTRISALRRGCGNSSATVAGVGRPIIWKGQRVNNTDMTGYGSFDVSGGIVLMMVEAILIVTSTTSLQFWILNEVSGGNTNTVGGESTLIAEKVA